MIEQKSVLLSTAYLPPVQYFSKIISFEKVFIEQHENYSKQSYRNRCIILGANGPLTLSIPVKKISGDKIPIRDVEIDYDTNWQKIHWKAIESAYGCSPFFLYYKDDLIDFYNNQIKYLFDLNHQLLELLMSLIKIKKQIAFTEKYVDISVNSNDFRSSIHPKSRMIKPDNYFQPASYYQVFREKYGFVSNLSVIDLLFNEGNNTVEIINKNIKKGD